MIPNNSQAGTARRARIDKTFRIAARILAIAVAAGGVVAGRYLYPGDDLVARTVRATTDAIAIGIVLPVAGMSLYGFVSKRWSIFSSAAAVAATLSFVPGVFLQQMITGDLMSRVARSEVSIAGYEAINSAVAAIRVDRRVPEKEELRGEAASAMRAALKANGGNEKDAARVLASFGR